MFVSKFYPILSRIRVVAVSEGAFEDVSGLVRMNSIFRRDFEETSDVRVNHGLPEFFKAQLEAIKDDFDRNSLSALRANIHQEPM